MELVQIELINHFTNKSAGTFVCKGDRFRAYLTKEVDTFTVFDCQYRSHSIPSDKAKIVTNS